MARKRRKSSRRRSRAVSGLGIIVPGPRLNVEPPWGTKGPLRPLDPFPPRRRPWKLLLIVGAVSGGAYLAYKKFVATK